MLFPSPEYIYAERVAGQLQHGQFISQSTRPWPMFNRPQVNKYKKSVVLTKTKSVLFPSAKYINTETANDQLQHGQFISQSTRPRRMSNRPQVHKHLTHCKTEGEGAYSLRQTVRGWSRKARPVQIVHTVSPQWPKNSLFFFLFLGWLLCSDWTQNDLCEGRRYFSPVISKLDK